MLDAFLAKIAPYHKAIAAVIGVVAWLALKRAGLDLPGFEGVVLDLVSGALIVGGTVYQAPANQQAENPD